jgi:hypothetical protein
VLPGQADQLPRAPGLPYHVVAGDAGRAELASQAAAVPDPARAAAQAARLAELLGTGRYPRFAAAVAQGGGPPATELGPQFERLLDRILDSLVGGAGP